jgi:Ca2+-binding EF-hand superfamily protein
MNQTFNLIFAIVLILSVNSKFMKQPVKPQTNSAQETIDAAGEKVFNKYQQDGQLDVGAFQKAFNDLAGLAHLKPLSENGAVEFVGTYDLDGTLTIDLEEWKRFLHLFESQLAFLPDVLSGKINVRSLINVAGNPVIFSKLIKAAFVKFDVDHSGYLDVDELLALENDFATQYLKGVPLSTREQMQAVVAAHDIDGNGSISLPEYLRMMRDLRTFYIVWLDKAYGLSLPHKVATSEVDWANLTQENVDEFGEEVFEKVAGKDGELDTDTFALVFNEIADHYHLAPITLELAQKFIAQYDLDGTETVDNQEFKRFLHLFLSQLHYLQGVVESHLSLNFDDLSNFVKSPVQFIRNLKAVFDKHAKNGVLDVDALLALEQEMDQKFFKNAPVAVSRDYIKESLSSHDVDGNGVISFPEYIRLMRDLTLFWVDYAHESFTLV